MTGNVKTGKNMNFHGHALEQLCKSIKEGSVWNVVAIINRFAARGESVATIKWPDNRTPMHFSYIDHDFFAHGEKISILRLDVSMFIGAVLLGAGFDISAKAQGYVNPEDFSQISYDAYGLLKRGDPERAEKYKLFNIVPGEQIALRQRYLLKKQNRLGEFLDLRKQWGEKMFKREKLRALAENDIQIGRAVYMEALINWYKKIAAAEYAGPDFKYDFKETDGKLVINPDLYGYLMEKTRKRNFLAIYTCIKKYKIHGDKALAVRDEYGRTPLLECVPTGKYAQSIEESKKELAGYKLMAALWLGAGANPMSVMRLFGHNRKYEILTPDEVKEGLASGLYERHEITRAEMTLLGVIGYKKGCLVKGNDYEKICDAFYNQMNEEQKEALMHTDPLVRKIYQYDLFSAFVKEISYKNDSSKAYDRNEAMWRRRAPWQPLDSVETTGSCPCSQKGGRG
ncbi:MAG: hypothetical protein LBU87_00535 [Lactobacillales bacterium]|jgi:hypothetical protein|nr:hypothetical protein [Lactobacillales bacterium]